MWIEFAGIKILIANQPSKLCCFKQFSLTAGKDFLIEHDYERVTRSRRRHIQKAFKFLLLGTLDRVFQIL